jgi:hypothetical protein
MTPRPLQDVRKRTNNRIFTVPLVVTPYTNSKSEDIMRRGGQGLQPDLDCLFGEFGGRLFIQNSGISCKSAVV